MESPIQLLITSRFSLSGSALSCYLTSKPSRYQVVFRECLSKEPLPAGFRPRVVIVNCADRCPFGLPSSRALYPFAKSVVISRSPSIARQVLWLRIGVHGIVDEADSMVEDVGRAIQAVLAGDLWVSRKVLSEYFIQSREHGGDALPGGLTEREREMMSSLRLGFSNASMARRFHLSEKTVKWHLRRIYRKLGVKNRTQATLRFHELQRQAVLDLRT